MKVALITPSFSRDFELARELCHSIDRFNEDGFEHILIVPEEDLPLFDELAGPGRRVISKESVLKKRPRKLPLPSLVGIPGVWQKRLRTTWLTADFRFVRGWMMQQVVKISASEFSDADLFVFLDSDAVFIRPFGHSTFVKDGKVPLLRVENAISSDGADHKYWQDTACDLLGIDRFPFEGDSNVAIIVPWRRDRLMEMQALIEKTTGLDYQTALLRQSTLSEYVLYSLFCRLVADGDAGHYPIDDPICHEDWGYDIQSEGGLEAFKNGLRPDHHVAVLMQSTNEWPIEKRRAILEDMRARAGLT